MPTARDEEVPRKSCIITLMIPIETDDEALAVKKAIDETIKNVEKKRYSFQIQES